MPALNRKGPEGQGAMTGRRMGCCNPENKGKTPEKIMQQRENEPSPTLGLGMRNGRRQGRVTGLGRGQGAGIGRGQGAGIGRGQGRGQR